MNKYAVIENSDNYIVCHGSGLTWAEAHLMILSQMLNDTKSVEDGKLQNVSLFELEANDPGLGVSYEYEGTKTTYYILDDPGKCEV